MIRIYGMGGIFLGSPEFIELSWNRKWKEAGDFSLYLRAEDYASLSKTEYMIPTHIQIAGRSELARIEKIVYEEKIEGHMVTLSGRFCESAFDTYAYINDSREYDSLSEILTRGAMTAYQAANGLEVNPEDFSRYEGSVTLDYNKTLGEIVRDKLKPDSFEMAYSANEYGSLQTGKLKPKKGKDLKDKVFFGEPWRNVKKIEYVLDMSAAVREVYAVWPIPKECEADRTGTGVTAIKDGESVQVLYAAANNSLSGYRLPYGTHVFEPSIDVGEVNKANLNEKQPEIEEKLRRAAELELLNHYKIETVNVEVLQNKFFYLKDYDLGDTCTVMIDELQQSFSVRIVEVREVYSKNSREIELVLGTPTKINYRKVMV